MDDDILWERLNSGSWRCTCCGDVHHGPMDLAHDAPTPWRDAESAQPSGRGTSAAHFLSDDFCVLEGDDFFVRCVLELPIIGKGGAKFGYGVWSSLSPANFCLYRAHFPDEARDDLGPWFGWFSSSLKGYPETLALKCSVHPRSAGLRPWIALEPTDHPLAVEQRDGITVSRLFDIYAENGHDLRA